MVYFVYGLLRFILRLKVTEHISTREQIVTTSPFPLASNRHPRNVTRNISESEAPACRLGYTWRNLDDDSWRSHSELKRVLRPQCSPQPASQPVHVAHVACLHSQYMFSKMVLISWFFYTSITTPNMNHTDRLGVNHRLYINHRLDVNHRSCKP